MWMRRCAFSVSCMCLSLSHVGLSFSLAYMCLSLTCAPHTMCLLHVPKCQLVSRYPVQQLSCERFGY